jgi:hypothetical protein
MQRRKMQEFKTALALALGHAVMCFGVVAVASSFLGK